MAGSSLRKSSKRRVMADINVVPYIDVMLVLLVIFMVTAPMVNPGVVNLPTVGGAKVEPYPPIFLTINANEKITVSKDGDPTQSLNKFEIGAFARAQAEKAIDQPIMIAGDRDIKYGVVMDVMSTLKENGIKRITLAVKTQ